MTDQDLSTITEVQFNNAINNGTITASDNGSSISSLSSSDSFLAVCFVGLFKQTANAPALLLCVINITVLANLLSVIAGGAISNDPVPGVTLTPIW